MQRRQRRSASAESAQRTPKRTCTTSESPRTASLAAFFLGRPQTASATSSDTDVAQNVDIADENSPKNNQEPESIQTVVDAENNSSRVSESASSDSGDASGCSSTPGTDSDISYASDSSKESETNDTTKCDFVNALNACGLRDVVPMLHLDGIIDHDPSTRFALNSAGSNDSTTTECSSSGPSTNRPKLMCQLYSDLRQKMAWHIMSAINARQMQSMPTLTHGTDLEELPSLWTDQLAGRDPILWLSQGSSSTSNVNLKLSKKVEWAAAGHLGCKLDVAANAIEPIHPHLEDVVALPVTTFVHGCPIHVFVLADGHGGRGCAAWFAERMPHAIASALSTELSSADNQSISSTTRTDSDASSCQIQLPSIEVQQRIRSCIRRLFNTLDQEFCDMRKTSYRQYASRIQPTTSTEAKCDNSSSKSCETLAMDDRDETQPPDDGCTLNVVVVVGRAWAISAHVGDSRTAMASISTSSSDSSTSCTLIFTSQDHSPDHESKARHIHRSDGEFRAFRIAKNRQDVALVRVFPPFGESTASATTTRAGRVTRSPSRSSSKRHLHHRNEDNSSIVGNDFGIDQYSNNSTNFLHKRTYKPSWTQSRYIPMLANARVARSYKFDVHEYGLRLKHMGLSDAMGDFTMKLPPALFECVPDVEFIEFPVHHDASTGGSAYVLIMVASDGVWDQVNVSDQLDVANTPKHVVIETQSKSVLSATSNVVRTFDEYRQGSCDHEPVCGTGFASLDTQFGSNGDDCIWSHPGIGTNLGLVQAAESLCCSYEEVGGSSGGPHALRSLMCGGRGRQMYDDASALLVRIWLN